MPDLSAPPQSPPAPAAPGAAPAGEFFATLRRSRLLPNDRADALREKFAGAEPAEAAAALVGEGEITRYQADRLLAGRYRGFFLDRYRLLSVLGAGGMGTVYVARDEGDGPAAGRKVAVKVLAAGMRDDAGMIARLRYEGVAGGRVDHPNVVRALRFCKADNGPGDYLLAMEFVEAVSTEELLVRGGPVGAGVACDVAAQTARGLAACHAAGLIHRDVKPANLLIDGGGRVKVADFGLALLTDQAAGEFSLQMIFGHDCLGSADFMAPEQSRNSTEIDPRADIYSLGCTLYSLLTARVPYPGKTSREVFRGHRGGPVPDVRVKAPETPPELAAFLTKLMAKDPADRPATAAEVAETLARWTARKPVRFDFEAILASRAKQAAKKEAARRKAREAKRRSSSAGSSAASRETATTAELDTARPDYTPGSSALAASRFRRRESGGVTVGSGLGGASAAALAGELLGAGSTAGRDAAGRDSLAHLSAVGLAPIKRGAAPDRTAAGDEEEDGGGRGPVPFPPTRLIPGRGWRTWFSEPIPVPAGRDGVVTIGRDAKNDLALPLPGVSGEHCALRWDGRGWRAEDLGSRNGTVVNRTPLGGGESAPLGVGDVLTLAGSHPFTLRFGRAVKPKGPRIVAVLLAVLAAAAGAGWWWLG